MPQHISSSPFAESSCRCCLLLRVEVRWSLVVAVQMYHEALHKAERPSSQKSRHGPWVFGHSSLLTWPPHTSPPCRPGPWSFLTLRPTQVLRGFINSAISMVSFISLPLGVTLVIAVLLSCHLLACCLLACCVCMYGVMLCLHVLCPQSHAQKRLAHQIGWCPHIGIMHAHVCVRVHTARSCTFAICTYA